MSYATKQYNDYELLYMIEDDSKEALEILVKKYEPLIYTRLIKFRIKKEYFDDYFLDVKNKDSIIVPVIWVIVSKKC